MSGAYRNNNNRRYWPRSSILYPPMEIVGGVVNRPITVLTTAAAHSAAPAVHPADPTGPTTLIVNRVAVGTIQ